MEEIKGNQQGAGYGGTEGAEFRTRNASKERASGLGFDDVVGQIAPLGLGAPGPLCSRAVSVPWGGKGCQTSDMYPPLNLAIDDST